MYISMYISIGKVSILLGASISTLRRWDNDPIVHPHLEQREVIVDIS